VTPPSGPVAETRLLIVSDVLGATQMVNFLRPFASRIDQSLAQIEVWTKRDISAVTKADLRSRLAEFQPTALILSRYTANNWRLVVDAVRSSSSAPVLYHLDDDLLAVPTALGSAKHTYYSAPARLQTLRDALAACDLVYTSTRPLAEAMANVHGINRPIFAGEIGCGVDPERFPVRRPRLRPTIGYMASSSHAADLDLVMPGLIRLMTENEHLALEFFGTLPVPEALTSRFGSRVAHYSAMGDYAAFLEKLTQLGWWAGLAPLEDTAFNRCKTEIKWLEYSFAGLPTVASNMEVYRRSCSSGGGLLVPDDSCWAATISRLLGDASERERLVDRARELVSERYTLDRLRRQVEAAIAEADGVRQRRQGSGARPGPAEAPVVARPPGPKPKEYQRWVDRYEAISDIDRRKIQAWIDALGPSAPLVSVVLLETGPPCAPEDLQQSIRSVLDQYYPRWELLTFGSSPSGPEAPDRRVRAAPTALLEAAAEACGDYVVFLQAGDRLAPSALVSMLMAVQAGGIAPDDLGFAYSDEDVIDSRGVPSKPYFKGDWDIDLMLGQDYASRLCMVPRDAVRRLSMGLRNAASVYRLLLRIVAERPTARVQHVPFVLYHRLAETVSEALPAEAVADYLAATGAATEGAAVRAEGAGLRVVWPMPKSPPRVSLVIPTRDRLSLLKVCVQGLLDNTAYPQLEVVILDNESEEAETRAYLMTASADPRVKVFYAPGPFNFSALNNLGVRQATGEVIGLLNNDLEVTDPNWLDEMVRHALRPEVGAVGPKLYYASGTIQHAGVVLGVGGVASHLMKHQPPDSPGYAGKIALTQQFSSVTGACLLTRKAVWDEVGGLDENLPVAFNDIDLCLKIRAAGYRVIWTPWAQLVHHESASRGSDSGLENRARLRSDSARMMQVWGETLIADPFFSPNLSLQSVDCRPAFPPRVIWPWWTDPKAGRASQAGS
jgi:GT2 family glycosyltransferase